MNKLDGFEIFGTELGSEVLLKLDEISIYASAKTLKEIEYISS
jgi:hypothetical protein